MSAPRLLDLVPVLGAFRGESPEPDAPTPRQGLRQAFDMGGAWATLTEGYVMDDGHVVTRHEVWTQVMTACDPDERWLFDGGRLIIVPPGLEGKLGQTWEAWSVGRAFL